MKTTNVENPGAASVIVLQGAKDLNIACSVIMGKDDISKNPLQITDAKTIDCYYDEKKGTAFRILGKKVIKADEDIMKVAHSKRVDTREVSEEELAKKGIKINEKGEVVREDAIEI